LEEADLRVFGPGAAAARIEGSKVFAKEFMARHGIPTARFRTFDDLDSARAHLDSGEVQYPLVLKADAPSALASAARMLRGESFGNAGRRIVVEEFLSGLEASFFVLSDETTWVP